ncbi:MAG: SDR family oxidoreductase [Novosphingobium sp.]|nr:SDR family oxidoreductase [Novosphingobium sp.]
MTERKTALVTGASRGIGAATAKALAADGYHVIVHYGGSRDRAEQVVAQIESAGVTAQTVAADMSDPQAPFTLAEEIKALCPDGLHALVLNAAIMPMSDLADCTPETFDEIFHINLRAPFFLLQQLSPLLVEHASVVFVSSLTARRVTGGVAAYGSMKAATESLTRRAAQELGARWIRVNAVCPATTANDLIKQWTDTPEGFEATVSVQALKRVAQPEDIADAISLLCSEKARWITGAVIPVDGGAML